jgi:hypothetical protein
MIGASMARSGPRRQVESARRPQLLQCPTDNRPRGLHPVRTGFVPEDGEVANESTRDFMKLYIAESRDHVVRGLTVLPRAVADA